MMGASGLRQLVIVWTIQYRLITSAKLAVRDSRDR